MTWERGEGSPSESDGESHHPTRNLKGSVRMIRVVGRPKPETQSSRARAGHRASARPAIAVRPVTAIRDRDPGGHGHGNAVTVRSSSRHRPTARRVAGGRSLRPPNAPGEPHRLGPPGPVATVRRANRRRRSRNRDRAGSGPYSQAHLRLASHVLTREAARRHAAPHQHAAPENRPRSCHYRDRWLGHRASSESDVP